MRRYLQTPALPTSKKTCKPNHPRRLPQTLFQTVSFLLAILFLATPAAIHGQTGGASITGRINDTSGAVLQDAVVAITNTATKVQLQTKSNKAGVYSFPNLNPGDYVMRVEKKGFRSEDLVGLTIYTNDNLEKNFLLQVGSVSESVTVQGGTTNTSPAVSMTVSREFIENMPLNGQSLQDLIQLAPGAVSDGGGDYSVDGQRTDTNNYTVDGVSANLGGINNAGGAGGVGLSGDSPMRTALGTTQSLASVDSLEEFKIQTSGYTAEYGRTPGGQIQFTTRSGANQIHGSLFDYFRNTAFDANSDENDYYGDPKTAEHQNDFGGTFGGPVVMPLLYNGADKSFFFFSYEGLRLILPAFESKYVPTAAFRQWASPNAQPYLDDVPLPNPSSIGNADGCTIPVITTGASAACDALFAHGYSYPSKLNNTSVRFDQNVSSRVHAFLRFADTPSSTTTGYENTRSLIANSHTWTAGLTATFTPSMVNEFRFNYSHDGEQSVYSLKSVGGAKPFTEGLLVPSSYSGPFDGVSAEVYIPDTSLSVDANVGGTNSAQHQYQFTDSISFTKRRHGVKAGADLRRLLPVYASDPYNIFIELDTLPDVQQGYTSYLDTGQEVATRPIINNLSLYAQDHWNLNGRLSLDYGLRWEFNPPPGPANGAYPAVLTSSNLATATVAPLGTQPYPARYDRFAPRFGFSWNAIPSQSHALNVRGGLGIFYDTGDTMIANAYTTDAPFLSESRQVGQFALPLSSILLAPPPLDTELTPPFTQTNGIVSPSETLPYTEQWTLSVDESLSPRNTLTLSYVGNNGKKLLFTQNYQAGPYGNVNFPDGLYVTTNASHSSYNALQVQDVGTVINGLDIVASFTYAHAIDNSSNDDSLAAPQIGNSDYDIPLAVNVAMNWRVPGFHDNSWIKAATSGWLFADRFTAQSGYPFSIIENYGDLGNGAYIVYSPDLVPHTPIYLHGSAAKIGGFPVVDSWRLNPLAFAFVPTDSDGNQIRQGTLGRNYLRTPSFWALNTSLQREFPIYDQLHLNFRVDAFNLLNHPNFNATPDNNFPPDSTFGELYGGSATNLGTPNALYAMGAARSLQLSLHVKF